MTEDYKQLRIKQLTRSSEPFLKGRSVNRPAKGWLSAMREVSGITLRELASRLRVSHQTIAALEKSEAADRVTLKRLRAAAEALDCQLVYAIVPRAGTVEDFAEKKVLGNLRNRVLAVDHSMALEAQQVGDVEEKIREEAARILKRGRK